MTIHNSEMRRLMDEHGFDELTAWRVVRDREIVRRRYRYQVAGRYDYE